MLDLNVVGISLVEFGGGAGYVGIGFVMLQWFGGKWRAPILEVDIWCN